MSSSTYAPINTYPDIVALRERYDQVAEHRIYQVVDGLMLLSGLYGSASAWVIGFNGQTSMTINNLITGLAIAALTVAFGSAYGRTHGMTFVAPLLGIWLIISPWIVSGADTSSTAMIWSNTIIGALVLLLGFAAAVIGMGRHLRPREKP